MSAAEPLNPAECKAMPCSDTEGCKPDFLKNPPKPASKKYEVPEGVVIKPLSKTDLCEADSPAECQAVKIDPEMPCFCTDGCKPAWLCSPPKSDTKQYAVPAGVTITPLSKLGRHRDPSDDSVVSCPCAAAVPADGSQPDCPGFFSKIASIFCGGQSTAPPPPADCPKAAEPKKVQKCDSGQSTAPPPLAECPKADKAAEPKKVEKCDSRQSTAPPPLAECPKADTAAAPKVDKCDSAPAPPKTVGETSACDPCDCGCDDPPESVDPAKEFLSKKCACSACVEEEKVEEVPEYMKCRGGVAPRKVPANVNGDPLPVGQCGGVTCGECGCCRGETVGCDMCRFDLKMKAEGDFLEQRRNACLQMGLEPEDAVEEEKPPSCARPLDRDMEPFKWANGMPVYEGGMSICRMQAFLWQRAECNGEGYRATAFDGQYPRVAEVEEECTCEEHLKKKRYRGGMSIDEMQEFLWNRAKEPPQQ